MKLKNLSNQNVSETLSVNSYFLSNLKKQKFLEKSSSTIIFHLSIIIAFWHLLGLCRDENVTAELSYLFSWLREIEPLIYFH